MIDSLEELSKILRKIINNSKKTDLFIELEPISEVFQEIRHLFGQTGKTGAVIKKDITAFLNLISSKTSLNAVYEILKKWFTMYEDELYVS